MTTTRAEFREFVAILARRMPHRTETEAVAYLMDIVERKASRSTDPAETAHLDQVAAAFRDEIGPAMRRDIARR